MYFLCANVNYDVCGKEGKIHFFKGVFVQVYIES